MIARRGSVRRDRWTDGVPAASGAALPMASTEELGRLFDRVVADQCVSDVPIGAFLSGGVDSTAVVAAMVASGNRPQTAYCIGFSGEGMAAEGFVDDLPFAKAAAQALGVPLVPLMMGPPAAEDFERLAFMLDEPQADPSPLFVEAICRAARADGVKVMMSGAGGDDIFSGYRRHRAAALRAQVGPVAGSVIGAVLGGLGGGAAPLRRRVAKLADLLGGDDDSFVDRCFHFGSGDHALACLSEDVRQAATAEPNLYWLEGLAASRGAPLVERVLRQERLGFLPDHNLNYTDKASMASGVEVRVPFLDPRLIAFADRIPWKSKTGVISEKKFLKRALADRVPRATLNRQKTGFGAPIRNWIKGPLRSMVGDTIASGSFRGRGVFDLPVVERTFDDVLHDRADAAYLLLEFVMIEFWMRAFLDQPGARPLEAGHG